MFSFQLNRHIQQSGGDELYHVYICYHARPQSGNTSLDGQGVSEHH